jgi:hypothetical protein
MSRFALIGSTSMLEACAPTAGAELEPLRFEGTPSLAEVLSGAPEAIVAFAPTAEERAIVDESGLPALIWWEHGIPDSTGGPRPNQRLIAGDSPDERLWRSVPLPVADRLYADPAVDGPARAAWIGPPTARRDAYLTHFGREAEPLEGDLEAVVAVNLHDDERPTCEHRALCALAQGRLLVSETLTPSRGLEPGIDYLEARDFDDLFLCLEAATRAPGSFRRVQLRGRRKAELFRASRVVPRLVGDLLLELGAP